MSNTQEVTVRQLIDALRIAMYGSSGAFVEEVELLGKLVATYDGVPYDAQANRLTQAVVSNPLLNTIEALNG